MKINKIILSIIIFLAAATSRAQEIDCSYFQVTGIQMDTLQANTMNVTILMGGSNSDFVNYPFISVIIDSTGDTIATGSMNFFGQIGNTSQEYAMTTSLDSIPADFNCLVYFNYDTNFCVLSFPYSSSAISINKSVGHINIYPNPSSGIITIADGGQFNKPYILEIYDSLGNNLYTVEDLNNNYESIIDLSGYARGIYFLRILTADNSYVEKVVKQ
jgi:hypothetical protein